MRMDLRVHGEDVLRRRAAEIPEITPEIKELAENMLETMYACNGVGLAAPQVGVSLRIAVIHVPQEEAGRLILINPVILERKGSVKMEEACLSVPGVDAPVERAEGVTVEFTTLAGKRKKLTVTGITARAVQHELDHLDGHVFIDRLSTGRRALLAGKLRKLSKRGGRA
jgi:peptide deformylase